MKQYSFLLICFLFLSEKNILAQGTALDSTFDDDGILTTDFQGGGDEAHSIALQNDGKIIAAGFSAPGDFAVARYLDDGSLDNSFGIGGLVTTSFNDWASVSSVIIQSDGKILAAGTENNYYLMTSKICLVRYNMDGTLDSSFSGGKVVTEIPNSPCSSGAIAIQTDGKIVAVGANINWFSPDSRVLLVRYNSDGTLDNSFGSSGMRITSLTNGAGASSLAIQSDGKIVVAGQLLGGGVSGKGLILRYNTDGSLDNSFASGGVDSFSLPLHDVGFSSMLIQPDGKIAVGGSAGSTFNGTKSVFTLVRYNIDGSIDSNFGNQGIDTLTILGNDGCRSIALQSDGKIVMAGEAAFNSWTAASAFALVRYNSDGALDSSVGISGKIITWLSNQSGANAVCIAPDGKMLLAGIIHLGFQGWHFAVARYISSLNVGIVNFSSENNSLLIFPNPIHDNAVLKYTLQKDETLSLYLYDEGGRIVKTFFTYERKNAGNHSETLRLPDELPPGIYVIVLTEGKNKISVKIVKQ